MSRLAKKLLSKSISAIGVLLFTSSFLLFIFKLSLEPSEELRMDILKITYIEFVLLLASLCILSWSYITTIAKGSGIDIVSALVAFVLITTVKYEIDTLEWSILHSACYIYNIILWINIYGRNNKKYTSTPSETQ